MTLPIQASPDPIGVFDSGVGGLTVVRRLWERLPDRQILFVADQAHVPYGGRPLEEIHAFASEISAALVAQGAHTIVMACNISTATALSAVQEAHPHHVAVGVIGPGVRAAVRASRSRSIGVLATEGTVRTGAYTRLLQAAAPDLRVTEVACPRFVPLIEAGETDSAEAHAAANRYLAPLRTAEVDVVILGCTHYPFLLPCLQAVEPAFLYLDPAEETTCELESHFQATATSNQASLPVEHILYTTGDPAAFARQVTRFLPDPSHPSRIAQARWRDGCLVLG